MDKKQEIIQEENELKDTIKTLKEELEELDEQLLRVNLKINQAVNEKSRMEEELRKYTKLGKQPKGKNQKQSEKNSLVETS